MTIKLEASTRLKATSIEAAAVPTATRIKLLKELFKNAKLKRFGLANDGEAITGADIDMPKKKAIGQALAELGWNTKWRRGVSREDGTWPLIIKTDKYGAIQIEVFNQDNVDKNVAKEAVKDYKAIVKEVAKTIGAKTTDMKRSPGRTGAGVAVTNGDQITPRAATKALMKVGYKKPKVKGNQLHFAKDHATVVLEYRDAALFGITCIVL